MLPPSVRVSIVLPVRNGEKHLLAALNSIQNQTFQLYELIIINDGSIDNTAEIIRQTSVNDHRITIINNSCSMGMGYVFNQGIHVSQGEYVARMDADDIAHPDRLAKQVDFLDANRDVVVVGSQLTLINEMGNLIGTRSYPLCDHDLRRVMARFSPFAHPATMFRRTLVAGLGGYDPRWAPAEDLDLWIRMSKHGKLANLPDALLSYRIHGESVTARDGYKMHLLSARVRINGVRYHDLVMSKFDIFLSIVQLAIAPLPFRWRMVFFGLYRHVIIEKILNRTNK